MNKGTALSSFAEKLGIPAEQTAAIGDYDNDLDMIRCAGIGIAMISGSDPARIADALDQAAGQVGVNLIGGYGALMHKGGTNAEYTLLESMARLEPTFRHPAMMTYIFSTSTSHFFEAFSGRSAPSPKSTSVIFVEKIKLVIRSRLLQHGLYVGSSA